MGKGKNGVPDRWEIYSNKGTVVKGTRFVSFKVPLKESLLAKLPPEVDRNWSPKDLIESFDLGLVIDLTFTTRYYDPKVLEAAGLNHVKIMTAGHEIPKMKVVKSFFDAVDSFLKEDSSRLIGVHCTHGLNRTGYLVCRYMIERLGMNPDEAILFFNEARGHNQERKNYLDHLREKGWEKEPEVSSSGQNTESKPAAGARQSQHNQKKNKGNSRWSRERRSDYLDDRSAGGRQRRENSRLSQEGRSDYLDDRSAGGRQKRGNSRWNQDMRSDYSDDRSRSQTNGYYDERSNHGGRYGYYEDHRYDSGSYMPYGYGYHSGWGGQSTYWSQGPCDFLHSGYRGYGPGGSNERTFDRGRQREGRSREYRPSRRGSNNAH